MLLLFFLCSLALGFSSHAWAKYEIDKTSIEPHGVPLDGEVFQWDWELDGDIKISWDSPGDNSIKEFVYKWSTSENAPTLNKTENDGVVDAGIDMVTAEEELFTQRDYDDSDTVVYLYIRTRYYDENTTKLSEPVQIGPINMDNVAPTGTVQLVDEEGNSIESTEQTTVNLKLSASVNPQYYYIQEDSSSSPTQDVDQYPYNSTIEYTLADSEPGEKEVFVWFEDAVGNISRGDFASVTFELLGDVYIWPNEATIDISQSDTEDFWVEGGTGGYDWSVINESTENVAQISTNSTNITSITLEGLNPGTCQLQAAPADPDSEYDTLTSGTITVEEGYVRGDANGDGEINIFDGVMFVNYLLGKLALDEIKGDFDLNDDGETNIFDGVKFVNYLLGKSTL